MQLIQTFVPHLPVFISTLLVLFFLRRQRYLHILQVPRLEVAFILTLRFDFIQDGTPSSPSLNKNKKQIKQEIKDDSILYFQTGEYVFPYSFFFCRSFY